MPASGLLPLVPFQQGGQPTLRASWVWPSHEARAACLVRRLPWARYSDGDDAERCRGHGRRIAPHRGERDVPATADVRASCCRGDNEAREHHYPTEQGRSNQRGV